MSAPDDYQAAGRAFATQARRAIREAIRARGLSSASIAYELGCSPQNVRRVLAHSSSVWQLGRVARAAGLELELLVIAPDTSARDAAARVEARRVLRELEQQRSAKPRRSQG